MENPNKHSSLRSQNCKMRLVEWFSNSIEHSKAYVNFGKWTNTTWQRQKQLKQREGKKMEAPVNRLCSCFSYAICKAPFDNWSFSSWKSFLSSNGRNEASALLLLHLPTLFKNYLKYRNKSLLILAFTSILYNKKWSLW